MKQATNHSIAGLLSDVNADIIDCIPLEGSKPVHDAGCRGEVIDDAPSCLDRLDDVTFSGGLV